LVPWSPIRHPLLLYWLLYDGLLRSGSVSTVTSRGCCTRALCSSHCGTWTPAAVPRLTCNPSPDVMAVEDGSGSPPTTSMTARADSHCTRVKQSPTCLPQGLGYLSEARSRDAAATFQAAMGSLLWSARTGCEGVRGCVALEPFACRRLAEAAGFQHR
jgi:hypothetical protein